MPDQPDATRPDNVQPTPDLDEVAMKDERASQPDPVGDTPDDPPVEDLTLPTE